MFRIGWVEVVPIGAAIAVGSVVGVLAHALGIWSLNPCRIVYVLEEHGERERFGFAYGTLLGHAVAGEERFSVEWDVADDRVTYDLLAFSRPAELVARVGRPALRVVQRRFAADSKRAMVGAVASHSKQVDRQPSDR